MRAVVGACSKANALVAHVRGPRLLLLGLIERQANTSSGRRRQTEEAAAHWTKVEACPRGLIDPALLHVLDLERASHISHDCTISAYAPRRMLVALAGISSHGIVPR